MMKIMFDLFCFLYFILYNLAGNHHIIIIFSCISRLQLFYSHDWRDHLLTKTGTSNKQVIYCFDSHSAVCYSMFYWNIMIKSSVVVWLISAGVGSWRWQCWECAVKLSECCWEASHGVCSGDGPASGVQSGPHLHNRRKPLLPAPQWISGELTPLRTCWDVSVREFRLFRWGNCIDFNFSFQEQVIQIKLHSIRRIYKRRHGLRPLVSTIST